MIISMEKDWIKIYETNFLATAEIKRLLLLDNNINSVIINKQDSSYHFGYIELYISPADKENALIIISENE